MTRAKNDYADVHENSEEWVKERDNIIKEMFN